MDPSKPTYSLARIKKLLCNSSSYVITVEAQKGAASLGYMDEEEILDVIEDIQEDDFYKSMPSEKVPSLWQDVYRVTHEGNVLYIKLQILVNNKKAVIIQFKEK